MLIKLLRKDERKYLIDLEKPIIWSIILFLCSGILGFIFIKFNPESATGLLNIFQGLAEKTLGMTNYELFTLIFINNSFKIILISLLGVFFGIAPLIFIILNGFLIGMVAFLIQEAHTWSLFWIGILPHGIFEIPILLVGSAIGLKLGDQFIRNLKQKESLRPEIKQALNFSFRVILPVLFFASFIEVFISQSIIDMLK